MKGKTTRADALSEYPNDAPESKDLMHARMSLVRNSGDPAFGRPPIRGETGSGEFKVSPDADGDGKSDRSILVKKQTNKRKIEHRDQALDRPGGVCGAKGPDKEEFESTGVPP